MARRAKRSGAAAKRRPASAERDPLLREAEQLLGATAADAGPASSVPGGGPAPAAAGGEAVVDAAPPPAAPVAAGSHAAPQLALRVSDDGLRAEVAAIHPGTTPQQVEELLHACGVTVGIDEPAIRKALRTARASGQQVGPVVVAQGRPPRPPGPPRLEPRTPAGVDALPSLEPLARAAAATDRDAVAGMMADLTPWVVRAGQVLASVRREAGAAGLSVQGKPVAATAPGLADGSPQFRPGTGVALAANGTDYVAQVAGYAGLLDGRPSVLSPVWLAADGMEACFLSLRPAHGSSALGREDLVGVLTGAGVRFGIGDSAVERLAAALADGDPPRGLVALAVGRAPVPAQDGRAAFGFEHRPRIGAVRADGSIDFRERNVFPPVHEGDRLLRCEPAAPGRPGRTVRDEEIPVDPPRRVEAAAGDNARLEERDGAPELYAGIDGGASVLEEELSGDEGAGTRYTVSVQAVAQVASDVGYETGNIDVPGNVVIGGAVKAGFRVRAGGDIAITGSVENGARLAAGGSVTVQQGILGGETRVEAGADVTAKYIQEATVTAGGSVLVGSYIHNAEVRARGRVRVEGAGGSGGGIVGGHVWAVQGIASRNLGSPRTTTTRIYVGIDPEHFAELEQNRRTLAQAETLLGRLLAAVGLATLDADAIRALLRSQPGRKATVLHYVKKANQLAQLRQQQLVRLREQEAAIAAVGRAATVDVADSAYAHVTVHIGNQSLELDDDARAVRLCVDADDERALIRCRPLAEPAHDGSPDDAGAAATAAG